eukprot:1407378-Rhodomonas_salina.3
MRRGPQYCCVRGYNRCYAPTRVADAVYGDVTAVVQSCCTAMCLGVRHVWVGGGVEGEAGADQRHGPLALRYPARRVGHDAMRDDTQPGTSDIRSAI